MIVMAVCVFGWVSYERLSLSLMPDIAYPTLTVRTEYPGAAPKEVENQISRRLEQELGILPHLATISSISKAGQSDIVLEFDQGEAISRQIEHIGRVMVRAIGDAPFGEVPGGFGKALLAGSPAPDDVS